MFPGVPRSLANSAGILLGPQFHFDVTRPGISLYGGNAQFNAANPIEPVVWLFGRIAQVHWAEAGQTVGYGAMHTLKRRTRIATVCIGYADGYLLLFPPAMRETDHQGISLSTGFRFSAACPWI